MARVGLQCQRKKKKKCVHVLVCVIKRTSTSILALCAKNGYLIYFLSVSSIEIYYGVPH